MTFRSPRSPPPSRPDNKRTFKADRGASEVVSFILTFSIITMMIGLLYTAGFVSMEQLQTGNQMQNAEGVFFAMGDSFDELQEGQAPKRAGALDLDVGASVSVSNSSLIAVEVNNATDTVSSYSLVTRSLDYRMDQRMVSYETGAVFRANDGNSAMVREPGGLFCSNETDAAVVSVVTLVESESVSVASGTVTVSGFQRSSTLLYPTDREAEGAISNVTVNVSSRHSLAWSRYLAETTGWENPDNDDTFVCEDVDQVFVRQSVIEVRTEA